MKPDLAPVHCLFGCAQPIHSQALAAATTLEVHVQLVSEVEYPSHSHTFTPRGHNQLLLTLDAQPVWQPLLPLRKHLEVV